MRYCSNCGTLSETDAKFCAHCGKAFDGTLPEEPVQVEEPAEAEPIVEEFTEQATEIPVVVPVADVTEKTVTNEQEDPESKHAPVYEKKAEGRPVRGRVFGIIGFVLSLESILCCLIPFSNFVGLIGSIIALIFCKISKKNTSFRLANVGHTLSVIALVFSIVTIIIYSVLMIVGILAISTDPGVQEFLDQLFTNGITITFN